MLHTAPVGEDKVMTMRREVESKQYGSVGLVAALITRREQLLAQSRATRLGELEIVARCQVT